ncbi:MAG: diguanylate cyclase [Gallionellaceae bacterium]|jgi:diguanylate cyclase (GGDEF)-like protein/PAS domain S-box-containing protein
MTFNFSRLRNTPLNAVIKVAIVVLGGEFLIMLFIRLFNPSLSGSSVFWEFLDPIVLAAIVAPVLHFAVLRPMRSQQISLMRAQAYNEMLLNSVAEGIYGVDSKGNCTFINSAGLDMLGFQDESELIGKNIHKLIHHTHSDGSHYPAEECPLYSCLKTREDVHIDEEIFWRKDGTFFPVDYWSRSVMLNGEGGAVVTFMDISERKRAEENLLITASVFENSQEAILITDANNIIVNVNPSFTRITGYRSDEILGKSPRILSSGRQSKAFYSKMWESLKREKLWHGEIWNRRKSGEVYAELLSITAICNDKNNVLRYVAVFSDITQIKEHEAALSRIAHFDALTGIPNRVLLADRMKQAIAQTSREKNMMAVCYLDLDGFKPINDTMGHEAGDEILIEVAHRIESSIRGGDTVARLGGDEFVVLLLGLARGEECTATLNRLLAAIAFPCIVNNTPCLVTASIGVGIFPVDDEDPDTLMRHADQAMYTAKQSGRNRFHIYNQTVDLLGRE